MNCKHTLFPCGTSFFVIVAQHKMLKIYKLLYQHYKYNVTWGTLQIIKLKIPYDKQMTDLKILHSTV